MTGPGMFITSEAAGRALLELRARDDLACYTADPSLFFPSGTAEERERKETEAKAICATCPARPQCRDYGLRYETHGTWGGLTEVDRRRLKRRKRRGRETAA